MKRRLAQFLLWVDYRTDGIRLRLFVAAAVVQVFLAPLWDQYLPFERVAARMEPMTFLATLNFLALTFALLGGRLLALSAPDDEADKSVSPRSVRQMFRTALSFAMRYFRLLRMEPWLAFISRIGAGLCVTLMALRGTAGLVRWTLWKAMRLVEDSLGHGRASDATLGPDLGVSPRAVGLAVGRALLHPALGDVGLGFPTPGQARRSIDGAAQPARVGRSRGADRAQRAHLAYRSGIGFPG